MFRVLVKDIFGFSSFFPSLWSSPASKEHKGKPSAMTLKRLAGMWDNELFETHSNDYRHAFQSPVETNEHFL